jgi:thiamine pyrophosphokinase
VVGISRDDKIVDALVDKAREGNLPKTGFRLRSILNYPFTVILLEDTPELTTEGLKYKIQKRSHDPLFYHVIDEPWL